MALARSTRKIPFMMKPVCDTQRTCTGNGDSLPALISTGVEDGCSVGQEEELEKKSEEKATELEIPCGIMTRVDQFLIRFSKWSSSGINQDRGLKLLQYSLWYLSRIVESMDGNVCADRSKALTKLSSNISMARYVLRFYGFFQSAEAARTGSWYSGWKSRYLEALGKIMTWSMVLYYPLEHVAYLGWEAPSLLPKSLRNANYFSTLSVQCWLAYIVADLTSTIINLNNQRQLLISAVTDEEKDKLEGSIKWGYLHITRCLLFLPPAIHWAIPNWSTKPLLRPSFLNGCMLAEAIVCLRQSLL